MRGAGGLFLAVLLAVPCVLCADTVCLTDGTRIETSGVRDEGGDIFVREGAGWRRFPREDVLFIRRAAGGSGGGGRAGAGPDGERTDGTSGGETGGSSSSGETEFEASFGPLLGMFFPGDSRTARYHGAASLLGAGAEFWYGRGGVRFEYEYYRTTYRDSLDLRDGQGRLLRTYDYSRELSLTPFWVTLLYRGGSSPYGFLGAGVGLVRGRLTSSFGGVDSSLDGSFTGIQLVTGIASAVAGLTLKYSFVDAGAEWGGMGLGGLSAEISLML